MASGGTSSTDVPTVLHRPRLLAALDSLAPIVALVGPIGAGATTLLRQWAAQRERVTWGSPGSIPDLVADALVISDADDLTADEWQRLRALRVDDPGLLIRIAVHSTQSLPRGEHIETVHDLLFTAAETRDYLAQQGSLLAPSDAHIATGGLPAALRAVTWLKTVGGAVMDEVLAALPPGALAAEHARLAIPEVLTRELATALGAPDDFIEQTERAGLGAWESTPGHPLFVLTAPVRAATLRAHPVDDADAVRDDAARTLLAQGAWYGAIVEGAASGSLAIVDAALRGGGMPLLNQHGSQIAARLHRLHRWELRRWPVTALALALIYNARHEYRLRAFELMGSALLGAGTAPSGSSERALLRVIESVLQRLIGLGDGGVKAARAATKILDELPPEQTRAIDGLLGDLRNHSAISLLSGGQPDEAAVQFERTLGSPGRPGLELISFGGIAHIHAESGDLATAQDWIDTALQRTWDDSILDGYPGSMLRMAQARLFIESGDLARADDALSSVWHTIDTIEHWPMLAHLRALVDIGRGEADEGIEKFRALRRRRGTRVSRVQTRVLDLTDSSLALAAGDLDAARALTARPGDQLPVQIGAARVLVFDGHFERARTMLAGIPVDSPRDRASVAVFDAVVLRRLERDDEAAVAARRARTITDAHGMSAPYLLVADDDRELFGDIFTWPAPNVGNADAAPRLTVRERVILRELVHSASMTDIAQSLQVSANTVKSQRRSLYRKLGARSRDEALAIAGGHGMLNG